MALLTPAELKAELNLTSNDRDARLTRIAAAASAAVKDYLGWSPETTSYTEDLNPNGGAVLSVTARPHCPVTVTSVYESLATPRVYDSSTLLTAGEDYAQERSGSSALIRLNANWPSVGRREADRLAGTLHPNTAAVRVVYTIDATNALLAAQEAALLEALFRWNLNAGQGIGVFTAEAVDGLSETLNTSVLPQRKDGGGLMSAAAAEMLKHYRKLPIC